ncbi:MAG: hypothetical protein AAB209_03535 [Bacteroidota bacterium]
MKTARFWAIAVVVAACVATASAQERIPGSAGYPIFADLKSYQEFDVNRFGKNFLGSLEYADCNDIVECGLAQVAMLKLAQPAAQLNVLKKKVDGLALHGDTPAVRYKAYLTSMVFEHPELFIYEKYGTYLTGEELFTALAQRLQIEALAAK